MSQQIKQVVPPSHPTKQTQPADKIPKKGHQDVMFRNPGDIPVTKAQHYEPHTRKEDKEYVVHVDEKEKQDKRDCVNKQQFTLEADKSNCGACEKNK